MFVRPTESPVVFLQQLGRGLRLYKGKEYLNVLDFIGNYEKAGKAPLLLSGEQSFSKKGSCEYQDLEYPDDCIVDFDMCLIDLFKEMDKKKLTLKMQIRQEYYRVKELLWTENDQAEWTYSLIWMMRFTGFVSAAAMRKKIHSSIILIFCTNLVNCQRTSRSYMRESGENSFRPSKLRRCRKCIRCRSFTAFIIMEISGLRLRMKRYWRVGRNSLIPGRTGRISRM